MRPLSVALVAAVVVALLALAGRSDGASVRRCISGQAKAFISIRDDPPFLAGDIPSRFTANALYFERRYNCRLLSAQVRRVDLGLYEVRFPGINVQTVLVTALSDEGVSASAYPLGEGEVKIALRGPLDGSDIAARRDVAFSVVVF